MIYIYINNIYTISNRRSRFGSSTRSEKKEFPVASFRVVAHMKLPQGSGHRRLSDAAPVGHRHADSLKRFRVQRVGWRAGIGAVHVHFVPGHQHGDDELGFQLHEMFTCEHRISSCIRL